MVGEAPVRRLCFTGAPPCRCHRRRARRRSSQLPLATPEYAQGRIERVGANRVAGDLVTGEFWPARVGSAAVPCVCVTDEWTQAVSERREREQGDFVFSGF